MSCVPCVCDLLGLTGAFERYECGYINNELLASPPRLGQLYTTLYTAGTYVPVLAGGVSTLLQRDLTLWFLSWDYH